MIQPTPPERFREVADELRRAEAQMNAPRPGAASAPEKALNEAAIAALITHAPGTFTFQGMRFRVKGLLSYSVGQRLAQLDTLVRTKCEAPDTIEEQMEALEVLRECARTFRSLVVPVRWLHRLTWRLLPNPFERMSMGDCMGLLVFFSVYRMKGSVRFD